MIEVLPAKSPHAAILAELHASAMEEPWTEATFAEFLEKPSITALLAISDEIPCGFVMAQRAADEAEILMIATHPSMRRKGVGSALVISVSEQLAEQGVTRLFLEVAEDNLGARALYEGCGFAEVGTRTGYYLRGAQKIDALLLRLDLVESNLRTT